MHIHFKKKICVLYHLISMHFFRSFVNFSFLLYIGTWIIYTCKNIYSVCALSYAYHFIMNAKPFFFIPFCFCVFIACCIVVHVKYSM